MVTRVVVGVADEDVEGDAGEQLAQRRVGGLKALPHAVSQIGVAGVPGLMLGEPEDGQRRDHGAATAAGLAIEPFDQQNMLVHGLRQLDGGHIETGELREPHGDVLALDDRVGVAAGAELGDEATLSVFDAGLRPRSADRAAAQQRVGQRRSQRHVAVHQVGGFGQFAQRGGAGQTRHVLGR